MVLSENIIKQLITEHQHERYQNKTSIISRNNDKYRLFMEVILSKIEIHL